MHSEDLKEKENKAGNPIFIIVIFVVLFGFLFFVPEIYKKYNSEIAEFLGIGNKEEDTGNKDNNQDNNQDATSSYYQIGSRAELTFNEITISDVELGEDKILRLNVSVDDSIDLTEARYYLEFFQEKKVFKGRRALNGVVTRSLPLEIDVSGLDIDTTTYFIVSHIDDSVIQPYEESTDESGLSSLTCTRRDDTYAYDFQYKKLIKVKYKHSYTNVNMEEYADELLKYQKMERTYNEYNGVDASLVDEATSFIFLSEFDYSTITSFSKIEDSHLFKKDELNYIIKFKMEAEGFDCE